MMNFLVKKFIPDYPENNVAVRTAAGVLSGTAGIFFNLLLFAAKLSLPATKRTRGIRSGTEESNTSPACWFRR